MSLFIHRPDGEPVHAAPDTPSSLYACLWHAWDEARAESRIAFEDWSDRGGREAYLVYRAAEDRADAAQDALASCYAGASRHAPPAGRAGARSPRKGSPISLLGLN